MPKLTACQILIGTSGWSYRDWAGSFYPKGIKSHEELTFYAKTFKTVENNSAFYHIPLKTTVQKWMMATPSDFIFSVKLNQNITHLYALAIKDETKKLLETYFEAIGQLQERLGAILIQLPARFHYNPERLEQFLKYYTKHYPVRTTIEFRHQSWFNKDTYSLLKKYNVALSIAQSSRYPLDQTITADFCYFRFHGPEKLFMSSYSHEQLEHWAGFIRESSKITKTIYIYFNNDWDLNAVNNGKTLEKILRQAP